MKENWHPFLKEERAILAGAEAHHIVEVEAEDVNLQHRHQELTVEQAAAVKPP